MAIFNSYVKLPEGIWEWVRFCWALFGPRLLFIEVLYNHPVSMGYLILTITQGISTIDEQIRYQPADGDFEGQPNQPLKL